MRHSPAYTQDNNHHGGWVIILTACGLILLLLCLLIRLYVRWKYSSTLFAADGVLAIAGFFAIVQSCLVFWEVGAGLATSGNMLTPDTINMLQKSWFATMVLYLFTVYLSKCVVVFVYLHLSPERKVRWTSFGVLALSSCWVVCSVLLLGIECTLVHPWSDTMKRCSNLFVRYQVITGLDVATEILLFLQSILLVWGTQMPFKRKSIVVTAFGLRLLVIIPSIMRLHYLFRSIDADDAAQAMACTLIWTEVQLHFSVICSVTYCFRSFTSAVSTNYGCAAINLDVYEETNGNLSAYASSRKTSKTPSTCIMGERFVGHGGKYHSSTIISAGPKANNSQATRSRRSGESTMVIIEEEIQIESSRVTPTRDLDSDESM